MALPPPRISGLHTSLKMAFMKSYLSSDKDQPSESNPMILGIDSSATIKDGREGVLNGNNESSSKKSKLITEMDQTRQI